MFMRHENNENKESIDHSRIDDVLIEQVYTCEDDKTFTYEVFINTLRGRDTVLVLSKSRYDTREERIEAESEWFYTSGSITVKKEFLNPQKELFLYVFDTYFECRVSNMVSVFSAPLTVKKWMVDQDNTITFTLDRSIWNYPIATGLLLTHLDEQSPIKLTAENIAELPNTRFDLQALDCWCDTRQFVFDARLVIDREGTVVYGAPTPTLTAFIAPPSVKAIAYKGDSISAEGSFLSGVGVWAGLYAGDILVTSLEAQPACQDKSIRVFSMEGIRLTHDGVFSLRFFYKTERGESLKTGRFPIVTTVPEATGFRMEHNNLILMFLEVGDYDLCWDGEDGKPIVKQVYASEAVIPKWVNKLFVNRVSGVSKGRTLALTLFHGNEDENAIIVN